MKLKFLIDLPDLDLLKPKFRFWQFWKLLSSSPRSCPASLARLPGPRPAARAQPLGLATSLRSCYPWPHRLHAWFEAPLVPTATFLTVQTGRRLAGGHGVVVREMALSSRMPR